MTAISDFSSVVKQQSAAFESLRQLVVEQGDRKAAFETEVFEFLEKNKAGVAQELQAYCRQGGTYDCRLTGVCLHGAV